MHLFGRTCGCFVGIVPGARRGSGTVRHSVAGTPGLTAQLTTTTSGPGEVIIRCKLNAYYWDAAECRIGGASAAWQFMSGVVDVVDPLRRMDSVVLTTGPAYRVHGTHRARRAPRPHRAPQVWWADDGGQSSSGRGGGFRRQTRGWRARTVHVRRRAWPVAWCQPGSRGSDRHRTAWRC